MPKTFAEELADVKALADQVKATKPRSRAVDAAALAPGTPSPEAVLGAPAVRKGENTMGSRGFSFCRLIGAVAGGESAFGSKWDHATVERDIALRLAKTFGSGPGVPTSNSVMAPFSTALMPDEYGADRNLRQEIKSLIYAGTEKADPDEMNWLSGKVYGTKAPQSWLDTTLGGALVGPPAFGELIDLYRNQAALPQAGCTIIPLPPTGRIIFPRQTNATLGYWVGENTAITATQYKTGQLVLSGKKCAAYLVLPNELIRYASPAAEALARMDMGKTLALTFDLAALEGTGTDTQPLGITNTPNITTVTPTTVATNGNTLAPQDLYKFPSNIEENNGTFTGFITRPQLYWALLQRRVDAAVAADAAGAFAFSPFRNLGDKLNDKSINGFKVTASPQVNNNRVKGSGTTLTYMLGGQWDDFIEAFFGAMEFAVATQGDTIFPTDQTAVRAILIGDCGARHPGVFALADTLINA